MSHRILIAATIALMTAPFARGAVTVTEVIGLGESRSVGTTGGQGLTVIDYRSVTLTAPDSLATFRVEFRASGFISGTPAELDHNGATLGVGPGGDMDAVGESIQFTNAQIVEFNANGGALTLADIVAVEFAFVVFDAASSASDSGVTLGQTWTDINDTADFPGHEPANAGINLIVANGGNAPSAFSTDYAGGSWRVSSVTTNVVFSVPEPSRFILIGLGAMVLGLRRRR